MSAGLAGRRIAGAGPVYVDYKVSSYHWGINVGLVGVARKEISRFIARGLGLSHPK